MIRINPSRTVISGTFIACLMCLAAGQQMSGMNWQSTFTIQKFALVNRCPSSDREAMFRCEDTARDNWNVRDTDYYTHTRKFCCFVWDTLSCQLEIAQRCDPEYATNLSKLTEQTYSSMCEYYGRRSVSCALRWWSIALIVLAIITLIAVTIGVVYYVLRSRKESVPVSTEYEKVTVR